MFSYAKDLYESNHQFLIKKQESTGLQHLHDSKAYWILKWYGWYLQKYWRVQFK